jgi:hypothetical protein
VTGNPPLWVIRDRTGMYINQAKITVKNTEARSKRGDEQVSKKKIFGQRWV